MRMRFGPFPGRLLAALGIFAATSCSDDLVAPTAGSIEITTATTGRSPDEGYTVAVDDGTLHPIDANASVTVPDVAPGQHLVNLAGLTGNCTVAGENPQPVSVTPGLKSIVSFDISCPPSSSASKIAFLSSRDDPSGNGENDLYLMNPDGSGVQKLAVGKDVLSFDWSPDGRRIVFAILEDEKIYAINRDGTGLVKLTDTPGIDNHEPDWSPDGSRIAFVGNGGIYVMNSDGSSRRRIITGAADFDWAPDGRKIAFERDRDVHAINVDGTGEVNLTNNSAENFKQGKPYWSPDGRTIAFTASPPNLDWTEIYVMNPDGTGRRRLTNNEGNDDTPLWAPNSSWIAFVTDRDRGQMHDSGEIYRMSPDGSNQTNLTNTPGGRDPSGNDELISGWSADGGKILYQRSGRIWVMNADGSGQTDLNQIGRDPAWSPE